MPVCLTTITTDCLSLLISNPPSSTSQISIRTVMSYKVNIWSYKIKMTDFILSAGGYFEMLRSGWSRRDHPDLMMFWYEQAFPPGYPVTRVFLVSRLKFAILSRTIEVPASLSSFFPTPAFSRY